MSNQTKPNQTKPNQTKSHHTKPNQTTILRQLSNISPVLKFVELFGAGSFHSQTGDMDPKS